MKRLHITEYFDSLGKSQKIYGKFQEPICKKWELTKNELDILLFLYNNPQLDRATDIVSLRGIAKSHVSMSVANLENRGLICREFNPEDRRTAHLRLTEIGILAAKDGWEAQQAFFERLYQGICAEEWDAWMEISQKIRNNINNME